MIITTQHKFQLFTPNFTPNTPDLKIRNNNNFKKKSSFQADINSNSWKSSYKRIMRMGAKLTTTDCPLRSCLGTQASSFRRNSHFSTRPFLPEIARNMYSTTQHWLKCFRKLNQETRETEIILRQINLELIFSFTYYYWIYTSMVTMRKLNLPM